MEADVIDGDGGVEAFDGGREEVGLEVGNAGSEVWVSVLERGWTRARTRDVRGGWLGLHGVSRMLRGVSSLQWVGRIRAGFGFFGFFSLAMLARRLDASCACSLPRICHLEAVNVEVLVLLHFNLNTLSCQFTQFWR